MKKNFAIVGVGLIGGSLALKCRKNGLANRIVGVDNNQEHGREAIELGLVDEMMGLDEAILMADVIVLAVPVGVLSALLPYVLDRVTNQVVIDMGSTKSQLATIVKDHPRRGRFVASHPMWGTEYSGPGAAVENAFEDKAVIVCDAIESNPDALVVATEIFNSLKIMMTMYMKGKRKRTRSHPQTFLAEMGPIRSPEEPKASKVIMESLTN
jgi:prephenate dehydrogenase